MKSVAPFLALLLVAQVGHGEETNLSGRFESDPAAFEKYLADLAKEPEAAAQQVAGGLTVRDLVDLTEIDPGRCSMEGLFDRWFTCEMVRPVKHVHLYCFRQLEKMGRFCARQVLGQNPDQFDPIRRPLVRWSRNWKLSDSRRRLWSGLLKVPEGDLAQIDNHLHYSIVPDCDRKSKDGKLYDYEIFPNERLEHHQLMEMLDNVNEMDIKRTIAVLSQAKAKEHTEVVGGVTVADLVQMNDISRSYCETHDEIIRRHEKCAKTIAKSNIHHYCRVLIRELAIVCQRATKSQEEPDLWWQGLLKVIAHDDNHKISSEGPEDKTPMELYLEKDLEVVKTDDEKAKLDEQVAE